MHNKQNLAYEGLYRERLIGPASGHTQKEFCKTVDKYLVWSNSYNQTESFMLRGTAMRKRLHRFTEIQLYGKSTSFECLDI